MSIHIEQLHKHFGDFHALQDINLTVPTGSLTALLGPSGCGKTTLLRIIAGLEQADAGSIFFDQNDVTHTHVRERKIGFMFQHYALFRHMNVFDNVAFGLQVQPRGKRPSKAQIAERVHELLKLVQLDWLAKAYPQQLSGGQRQRIALARALATEPKLLLLDEPFGALDAKVRKELRQWLRDIHHSLGITSILVTHDQEEALEMADQLVVMNHGKIEQSGTPEALYQRPCNVFVTEFLGEANVFENAAIEQGRLHVGNYSEPVADGSRARQSVTVYIRPHELALLPQAQDNTIAAAQIAGVQAVGAQVRVALQYDRRTVHAVLSPAEWRSLNVGTGQTVWLQPRRLTVFRLPEMVEYVI